MGGKRESGKSVLAARYKMMMFVVYLFIDNTVSSVFCLIYDNLLHVFRNITH